MAQWWRGIVFAARWIARMSEYGRCATVYGEVTMADVLDQLAPYMRYGPGYVRAVAEHAYDARRFAARGEYQAATHYALLALVAADLMSWEEYLERDPFGHRDT